jgi:hypothetical protein
MRDLEERLAGAFPELRVAPLTELAVGFHSVAVETDDGVVFRIPRYHGTADGHATEFRVLPELSGRLPVAIPFPEWRIEPGHPDFPLGAIGYHKLPGSHPEVGTGALAAGLGAFLVVLHSLELDVPEAMPSTGRVSRAAIPRKTSPLRRTSAVNSSTKC